MNRYDFGALLVFFEEFSNHFFVFFAIDGTGAVDHTASFFETEEKSVDEAKLDLFEVADAAVCPVFQMFLRTVDVFFR